MMTDPQDRIHPATLPGKSAAAFRTISEVASELDLPQHVLRFWESKFTSIRPLKRGGGRRYYRPEDVGLLRRIRTLLYEQGYTIKGVQKLLRQNGGAKLEVTEPEAAETETPPEPIIKAAAPPLSADARAEIELAVRELEALRDLVQGPRS